MYILGWSDIDNVDAFSSNMLNRGRVAITTDSLELLEVYTYDPVLYVRKCAARNPRITPEIRSTILEDPSLEVKFALLDNPTTPSDIIVDLYKEYQHIMEQEDWEDIIPYDDWRYEVEDSVASNPNTPQYLVEDFCTDPWNSYARSSAARNPNISVELLRELAKDDDDSVVSAVAANPNTPEDVLADLADSYDPDVRWSVANNPSTPLEILKELAQDRDIDVSRSAIANSNYPGDV